VRRTVEKHNASGTLLTADNGLATVAFAAHVTSTIIRLCSEVFNQFRFVVDGTPD
jgi:hypothetical protein